MQYLKTLIFVCFLTILTSATFSQPATKRTEMKINQQHIESRISELAKFGKDSSGKGYRVAYTKDDIEGRNWSIISQKLN